jgi:hypothetical protein
MEVNYEWCNGSTAVLKRRIWTLSMEKYKKPPTEWVTYEPKLVPTMQCQAGP